MQFRKAKNERGHICFVAQNAWPVLSGSRDIKTVGGAEVQQSYLARGLVSRGYKVSMVCLDFGQPDGAVVDGITVYKAHVPNARCGGIPVIRFFHPRMTSMWQAMGRADADIYYQRCAGGNTGIVGLFARRHNRRFVYAAASDFDLMRDRTERLFHRRGGWRDRQLFYLGLRMASAVLAQHPYQADAFHHWYGRKAIVVPNCYAPPPNAHSNPDGVVLWVGNLHALKQPALLLDLARRLPHLRFRMVGGPSAERDGQAYFEEIRTVARSIPNIEFIGFVPYINIDAQFDSARLFVNTSEYEGFPNTFLQSWARGIPTVSFTDCGAREAGQPIGMIAKDMQEMTEAVQRLSTDRHEWQKEGARARRYFEANHSVDVAIGHYDRLIRQLMDPGRKP